MKKLLVVLVLLAFVGSGAFAQSLTFSGQLFSGLGIMITDYDDVDPLIGQYAARENMAGGRAQLVGTYLNADENVGGQFRFRVDGAGGEGITMNLQNQMFEMWFQPTSLFRFGGGNLDNQDGFDPAGGIRDGHYGAGSGWGTYVRLTPIPGFNARLGIFPTNFIDRRERPGDSFASDIANVGFRANLRYQMPGVFTAFANFRQGGQGSNNSESTDLLLAAQIHALSALGFRSLVVDFGFNNLQSADGALTGGGVHRAIPGETMMIRIGQNIIWGDADGLELGLRMQQAFLNGEDADRDDYTIDLTFSGYLQYALGNIVPRLNVGFNMGSLLASPQEVLNAAAVNETRAHWNAIGKEGFMQDAMNFNLNPNVQFRFGAATQFIELGYILQMSMGDAAPEDNGALRHLGYLHYQISF